MQTNTLVVGAGAAGLATALRCADGGPVTVLAKKSWFNGATAWAQGGIAAVSDPGDSIDWHIQDTLVAGAGLSEPRVVESMVSQGPEMIAWLQALGVAFERHLGQEGGHRARRIVHVADRTGRAVAEALVRQVKHHPNITVLVDHTAVDLWLEGGRCQGVWVVDPHQRVQAISASSVVLATGGASKTYLYTTSPETASGDGMAMAYRAGCRLVDLEFNQFHPTCLYHAHSEPLLMTEAIRGEGGRLMGPDGYTFMKDYDGLGELACRDVVARAIDHFMKKQGLDCVLLDISHREAGFVRQRFPTLYQRCLALGMDMTQQAIPVVPAAHYTCGGIFVDSHGRTDVPGLWAVGECACTGLHGANRLASNSLLECLVGAKAVALDVSLRQNPTKPSPPVWAVQAAPTHPSTVNHDWDACRRVMWDYVGIVRHPERLLQAKTHLALLADEIQKAHQQAPWDCNTLECVNLITLSQRMVESASVRLESRGLHALETHPVASAELEGVHTWVQRGRDPWLAPWPKGVAW